MDHSSDLLHRSGISWKICQRQTLVSLQQKQCNRYTFSLRNHHISYDFSVPEMPRKSVAHRIESESFFEGYYYLTETTISTHDLTKYYGTKSAIKNIDLKVFKGQITVILGRDGSGKSTLLTLLSGLTVPTSGNATVQQYDLLEELEKVQGVVGYCPQKNILFADLTVWDHMFFFGTLKGLQGVRLRADTRRYLELLELRSNVSFSFEFNQTNKISYTEKRADQVFAELQETIVVYSNRSLRGFWNYSVG